MSQDARFDEEQATARRAGILGLAYVDVSQIVNKQLYDVINFEELSNIRVVPLSVSDHAINFGVTNTTSQQTMQMLRQRFLDQRLEFSLISDTGFRDYMTLYNPPKKIEYADIQINSAGDMDLVARVSATIEQVRADDVLAYLVQQAHKLNASDIHLESQEQYVRVRFRIDGVLHVIARITYEKYRVLLSAIASAANISTASADSQQGHIAQTISMADGAPVDVNVRLETSPTINGIDIVMRLFNMDQSMYSLDRLGLSEQERAVIDDIIAKPSGMVLVVGPTGSGKTTTLYSMLNTLNSDERKIITIEDPVEYRFEGISQLSVASQNTQSTGFAEKLRATLRLDPDVLMIGEIRDSDTAKTALQAALTGHLVLSTFHAAGAAAALTRLEDVIGQNPLFMSAIRLVMAQRLIRRLDPSTKQPYQPDDNLKRKLQTILDTLPASIERPNLDNLTLYKAGQSEENPYGYNGQIALREQFIVTPHIREILEKGVGTSSQQIENAAIADGMKTMLQDGVLKLINGETTVEEVFRVVG